MILCVSVSLASAYLPGFVFATPSNLVQIIMKWLLFPKMLCFLLAQWSCRCNLCPQTLTFIITHWTSGSASPVLGSLPWSPLLWVNLCPLCSQSTGCISVQSIMWLLVILLSLLASRKDSLRADCVFHSCRPSIQCKTWSLVGIW